VIKSDRNNFSKVISPPQASARNVFSGGDQPRKILSGGQERNIFSGPGNAIREDFKRSRDYQTFLSKFRKTGGFEESNYSQYLKTVKHQDILPQIMQFKKSDRYKADPDELYHSSIMDLTDEEQEIKEQDIKL
jgi:hypothetical protein